MSLLLGRRFISAQQVSTLKCDWSTDKFLWSMVEDVPRNEGGRHGEWSGSASEDELLSDSNVSSAWQKRGEETTKLLFIDWFINMESYPPNGHL